MSHNGMASIKLFNTTVKHNKWWVLITGCLI